MNISKENSNLHMEDMEVNGLNKNKLDIKKTGLDSFTSVDIGIAVHMF